ncbi:MAG: DUF1963 domain-containing protein [Moraxella sp.]|nr:DUF1963 domain-containing protein [Moraxella sp.]
MNNKLPFIQAKIAEMTAKLQKPITEFQTGGFTPTDEHTTSWLGRVFLCKADEVGSVVDNHGKPLYPLAQFYLPSLPFVPDELKHIMYLMVFMGDEFPDVYPNHSQNGNGWLIREYTTDDELLEHEYDKQDFPKPFPLKPIFKERDFPLWDGGGIPPDIEDEICELEDDDTLDYYNDIMGDEHSYAHKFGGYPSFCQSGVEFDDNCRFMFQISSDDKAGFNVIDSGSLMFARNDDGRWVLYYDFY